NAAGRYSERTRNGSTHPKERRRHSALRTAYEKRACAFERGVAKIRYAARTPDDTGEPRRSGKADPSDNGERLRTIPRRKFRKCRGSQRRHRGAFALRKTLREHRRSFVRTRAAFDRTVQGTSGACRRRGCRRRRGGRTSYTHKRASG